MWLNRGSSPEGSSSQADFWENLAADSRGPFVELVVGGSTFAAGRAVFITMKPTREKSLPGYIRRLSTSERL